MERDACCWIAVIRVPVPDPAAVTPLVNTIKGLRAARGEMTQQALADACSVTRQTIIAVEAGKHAPSLELAFRLARTFNVSIEDVFQWRKEA